MALVLTTFVRDSSSVVFWFRAQRGEADRPPAPSAAHAEAGPKGRIAVSGKFKLCVQAPRRLRASMALVLTTFVRDSFTVVFWFRAQRGKRDRAPAPALK